MTVGRREFTCRMDTTRSALVDLRLIVPRTRCATGRASDRRRVPPGIYICYNASARVDGVSSFAHLVRSRHAPSVPWYGEARELRPHQKADHEGGARPAIPVTAHTLPKPMCRLISTLSAAAPSTLPQHLIKRRFSRRTDDLPLVIVIGAALVLGRRGDGDLCDLGAEEGVLTDRRDRRADGERARQQHFLNYDGNLKEIGPRLTVKSIIE